MSGPLTYGHFELTGWQDCDNVWENGDVDFSSGNSAEEIIDRSLEWMSLEQWLEQNEGFEDLDPEQAYRAWKKGWRACAIIHVQRAMPYHLTKVEAEFQAALTEPGVNSLSIAQDIALESGLKLVNLGEKYARVSGYDQYNSTSIGVFGIDTSTWVRWEATQDRGHANAKYKIVFYFSFRGQEWAWSTGLLGGRAGVLVDLKQARQRSAEYAWLAVKVFKRWDTKIGERPPTQHELSLIARDCTGDYLGRSGEYDYLDQPVTPDEVYQNPGQPEIKDEDNAVDKYREFNSFDPKDLVYVDGSPIPKKLRCLGEATQLLYESMKVIPDNGVKPRKPVAYMHDHEGDVYTYVPDDNGDHETPSFILECDALALLGKCLGYTIKGEDGKKIEAQATRPFPEFYCTPDGRALLVIQSKKTVLAIIYGGALGVESRGIVG